MFPTSTPRLMASVPTPHFGHRSPARTSAASIRSPWEIATDQHVAKVGVLLVRDGDIGTVLDTLVHQKTRLEADGSDVAGNRARGGEVGVVRELHLAGRQDLANLGLIDVAVAGKHDRNDLSGLIA